MSYRRFILFTIAALCLLLPTNVSAVQRNASGISSESIGRTDNAPQWQDIGMNDVLAVTGSTSIVPPTTVRVVHDSQASTAPTAQMAQARHYKPLRLTTHSSRPMKGGYIYLIRCLRL
ncbi:MAG: hypothetical protein IJL38_00460 [Bacteroidales bacterium]|nr:hypothetical protein [Bacteroidales bacterium]